MSNSIQGRLHILYLSYDNGATYVPAAGFKTKELTRDNPMSDETNQASTGQETEICYNGHSDVTISGSGVGDTRDTDLFAFNDLAAIASSSDPTVYLKLSEPDIGTYTGQFRINSMVVQVEQNGIVEFSISLRNAGPIDFFIGELAAVGDYYMPLSEPNLNRYVYNNSAYQYARTDTPITLEIGDTVAFTYDSITSETAGAFFVHSSVSASNLATFGYGTGDGGVAFVGFTGTLDGNVLNEGDLLPNTGVDNISDYQPHRIVLTATVQTDFHHIASDGTGADGNSGDAGGNRLRAPMYDIEVTTGLQIFNWGMHEYNVATQVEDNGDPNSIIINNEQLSRWVTWPFCKNTVDDSYFFSGSNPTSGDNIQAGLPSLRPDGLGFCLKFDGTVEYMKTDYVAGETEYTKIPYSNGFTVEVIAKYIEHTNSSGRACGVLSSFLNNGGNSLWALGFDNFQDPTNTEFGVFPAFSLLARNEIYSNNTDFVNNVADIRSQIPVVAGDVFHLMFTIRPSDNSVEFWINGVSTGAASLGAALDDWFAGNGNASQNLLDGSQQTYIGVGPRYINGAWRSGQESEIQDVKIHLLEADQAFASRQNPFTVNGLFRNTIISNFDEPLASTRISDTTALVTQADADLLAAGSSMYSQNVILFGAKAYFEVIPLDFGDGVGVNSFWVGMEVAGVEEPQTNTGQSANQIGYSRSGDRYVDGVFGSGLGFNYAVNDVVAMAVDYTSLTVAVDVYLNGVLQESVSYDVDDGVVLRPASQLTGAGSNGPNASGQMLLGDDTTYPPPVGFVALDNQ